MIENPVPVKRERIDLDLDQVLLMYGRGFGRQSAVALKIGSIKCCPALDVD